MPVWIGFLAVFGWVLASVVIALLVGAAIRLRDGHEAIVDVPVAYPDGDGGPLPLAGGPATAATTAGSQ